MVLSNVLPIPPKRKDHFPGEVSKATIQLKWLCDITIISEQVNFHSFCQVASVDCGAHAINTAGHQA